MENVLFTGILLPVVAGVLVVDVLFLRAKLWSWLTKKNKNLIDDIRPDGGGPRVYRMKTIEFHYSVVCVMGIFLLTLAFFLDLRMTSPSLIIALMLTSVTAGPVSLLYIWTVAYVYNSYWYKLTGSQDHFSGVKPVMTWVKKQTFDFDISVNALIQNIERLFSNNQRR